MKKFLLKLFWISLPFLLITLATIIINPYNYPYWMEIEVVRNFREQRNFDKDSRLSVAVAALDIDRKTVFVGDSRTNQLFDSSRPDSLPDVFNLAVGGSCFNEIVDLAWHVLEKNSDLNNLYIGLNFNHYGIKNKLPLMSQAIQSCSSLPKFVLNKHNYIGSFRVLTSFDSQFIKQNEKNTKDIFNNEDEFWEYQIESAARNFYETMKPNPKFKYELDSLVQFCNQNKIKITLFSPPTHIELQNQVQRWGKSSLKHDYLDILSNLSAPYINLDQDNDFTRTKSNFKDPFHLASNKGQVLKEIIESSE